jgi:hypothetical protein
MRRRDMRGDISHLLASSDRRLTEPKIDSAPDDGEEWPASPLWLACPVAFHTDRAAPVAFWYTPRAPHWQLLSNQ